MDIKEKLEKWAKETVDVYNPIAESLGYYTQSVLDRESLDPDILILGIISVPLKSGRIKY